MTSRIAIGVVPAIGPLPPGGNCEVCETKNISSQIRHQQDAEKGKSAADER
jgi:hypothetical protein